jgi:hypothetical protein
MRFRLVLNRCHAASGGVWASRKQARKIVACFASKNEIVQKKKRSVRCFFLDDRGGAAPLKLPRQGRKQDSSLGERHIILGMPDRSERWKAIEEMSPSDFSIHALSEAYRMLVGKTGIDTTVVRSAFAEMLGYLLASEGPEVVTTILNEVLESKMKADGKSNPPGTVWNAHHR